jgi:class 3 adenylate cyclase
MALDMIDAVERMNVGSTYKLQVRIGIATGPAMAGVVGKHKFLYDLWGSAVNTASRMESHGMPGRIQLADATRKLLNGAFEFEERGTIEVKGMGAMHTWFLNGRTAADVDHPIGARLVTSA